MSYSYAMLLVALQLAMVDVYIVVIVADGTAAARSTIHFHSLDSLYSYSFSCQLHVSYITHSEHAMCSSLSVARQLSRAAACAAPVRDRK